MLEFNHMQITSKQGTHCEITVQSPETATIAIDPSKKTKADIIISFSNSAEGDGFIINNPGEYEIKNVYIERPNGSIINIMGEEIRLCYVFSHELEDKDIESAGNVDILIVPIKNDVDKAVQIVKSIEPRLVIPIDFKTETPFLKGMGIKEAEKLNKLTIKAKNLPEEETKVVILTS